MSSKKIKRGQSGHSLNNVNKNKKKTSSIKLEDGDTSEPEQTDYVQLPSADVAQPDANEQIPKFKDLNYVRNKTDQHGKRLKVSKNLKQIISAEKQSRSSVNDVIYSSLDVPPSLRPNKKYSDITGIEASYTDPHTKIRYANSGEFRRLKILPPDIISGLLTLRRANPPVH